MWKKPWNAEPAPDAANARPVASPHAKQVALSATSLAKEKSKEYKKRITSRAVLPPKGIHKKWSIPLLALGKTLCWTSKAARCAK